MSTAPCALHSATSLNAECRGRFPPAPTTLDMGRRGHFPRRLPLHLRFATSLNAQRRGRFPWRLLPPSALPR